MPERACWVLACAIVTLQLAPGLARADDEAADIEFSVKGTTLHGEGWPQLIVTTGGQPLMGLRVELQRSDGQTLHLKSGKIGEGDERVFDLRQPDGAFHYEGTIEARFRHGPPHSLPVSFDTAVFSSPRLTIGEHPVDLAAHTATITADRPIATLTVHVLSDDGSVLDDEEEKVPEGAPLVATWKQPEQSVVLEIDVTATDKYGFYQQISFFPWKVEIPHEDVLFETGTDEIRSTEQPKVAAALAALRAAIEKYGRFAKVELFVAGYTDTVGDAASNKLLSENRARSIARAFRTGGAGIPISYAGFGEEQLLVPTADETPESRNRRATYIVAITPPTGIHWTRLAP